MFEPTNATGVLEFRARIQICPDAALTREQFERNCHVVTHGVLILQ
jgi:hypothetical protein